MFLNIEEPAAGATKAIFGPPRNALGYNDPPPTTPALPRAYLRSTFSFSHIFSPCDLLRKRLFTLVTARLRRLKYILTPLISMSHDVEQKGNAYKIIVKLYSADIPGTLPVNCLALWVSC